MRQERLLYIEDTLSKLSNHAETNYFDMCRMLNEVREQALWTEEGLSSFKEWVEQQHLPTQSGSGYTWATRAADTWKYLGGYPTAELVERGRSRLIRLIPLARKNLLTDDLWRKSALLADRELREEIAELTGRSITNRKRGEEVTCPRCGEIFETV